MAASSSDAPLPAAPQRKRRTGTPAFSAAFLEAFETHTKRLKQAHEVKKEATSLKNVAIDKDVVQAIDVWDTLGKRQPSDKFNGCVNLRTLRTLLGMIDERGFERSEHQRQFHSAFERCVSRVVYKGEWAKDRTSIMAHNDWARCSSEVMISTPRRFGKTFSIAIFVACLCLSFGCECVIFSPARRASRKLLERICEFVKLLDCEEKIIEYNQENLRLSSFNGRPSLIRSFPSKVGTPIAMSLRRTPASAPGPGSGSPAEQIQAMLAHARLANQNFKESNSHLFDDGDDSDDAQAEIGAPLTTIQKATLTNTSPWELVIEQNLVQNALDKKKFDAKIEITLSKGIYRLLNKMTKDVSAAFEPIFESNGFAVTMRGKTHKVCSNPKLSFAKWTFSKPVTDVLLTRAVKGDYQFWVLPANAKDPATLFASLGASVALGDNKYTITESAKPTLGKIATFQLKPV